MCARNKNLPLYNALLETISIVGRENVASFGEALQFVPVSPLPRVMPRLRSSVERWWLRCQTEPRWFFVRASIPVFVQRGACPTAVLVC